MRYKKKQKKKSEQKAQRNKPLRSSLPSLGTVDVVLVVAAVVGSADLGGVTVGAGVEVEVDDVDVTVAVEIGGACAATPSFFPRDAATAAANWASSDKSPS